MKIALRLTLDGLVRALRTKAHDLAGDEIARRTRQTQRRKIAERRQEAAGRKS